MNIRKSLDELEEEIETELSSHERRIEELEHKINEVRNSCPHPKWRYHPDASGNNDSWNECVVCGKED